VLESNALALRLLKSGQAALPVTRDFWGDLSRGLGATTEEIGEALELLYAAGLVEGAWTEPNPALDDWREALVAEEPGDRAIVRWHGGALHSVVTPVENAWLSQSWFKSGFLLDFERGGADFSPQRERTTSARACTGSWDFILPPARITPSQSPWEHWGKRLSMDPERVRREAAHAVAAGHFQRFAWRVRPAALGFEGCGMACWKLAEAEAPRAAVALAELRATGDVCVRLPTAQHPFNLTALVLARRPGDGERLAHEIGGKWGRPLGRWIDLELA